MAHVHMVRIFPQCIAYRIEYHTPAFQGFIHIQAEFGGMAVHGDTCGQCFQFLRDDIQIIGNGKIGAESERGLSGRQKTGSSAFVTPILQASGKYKVMGMGRIFHRFGHGFGKSGVKVFRCFGSPFQSLAQTAPDIGKNQVECCPICVGRNG